MLVVTIRLIRNDQNESKKVLFFSLYSFKPRTPRVSIPGLMHSGRVAMRALHCRRHKRFVVKQTAFMAAPQSSNPIQVYSERRSVRTQRRQQCCGALRCCHAHWSWCTNQFVADRFRNTDAYSAILYASVDGGGGDGVWPARASLVWSYKWFCSYSVSHQRLCLCVLYLFLSFFFLWPNVECPFFLFATIDDGRNLFCRAIFDATSTINLRIWYWRIQLCRRMREFACCRFIDVIDGWQWPTFLFRTQPSHKSRSAVISLSCNVAAFARWRSATITNKMIYENVFGRRIFPGCHTRLYHILLQPTALLLCSVNLCGSCTAHFFPNLHNWRRLIYISNRFCQSP